MTAVLGTSLESGGRHRPSLVQAIVDFPQPTSLHKLHEFLGFIDLYYRFILKCADTPATQCSPHLNCQEIQRTGAAITAFMAIKEALATATLLLHLKLDTPTNVVVNASDK